MVFDHTVQVRDPKTGRTIATNDYALHIDKDGTRYERPIGSGNFFKPDGSPIPKAEAPVATGKADQKQK